MLSSSNVLPPTSLPLSLRLSVFCLLGTSDLQLMLSNESVGMRIIKHVIIIQKGWIVHLTYSFYKGWFQQREGSQTP